MVRRVSELLTGSLIVLAFAVPAIAQGGRAEINGSVIDAGNAVVPGATITVTEENTGLQRTTISSADGRCWYPLCSRARTRSRLNSRASRPRHRPASCCWWAKS